VQNKKAPAVVLLIKKEMNVSGSIAEISVTQKPQEIAIIVQIQIQAPRGMVATLFHHNWWSTSDTVYRAT